MGRKVVSLVLSIILIALLNNSVYADQTEVKTYSVYELDEYFWTNLNKYNFFNLMDPIFFHIERFFSEANNEEALLRGINLMKFLLKSSEGSKVGDSFFDMNRKISIFFYYGLESFASSIFRTEDIFAKLDIISLMSRMTPEYVFDEYRLRRVTTLEEKDFIVLAKSILIGVSRYARETKNPVSNLKLLKFGMRYSAWYSKKENETYRKKLETLIDNYILFLEGNNSNKDSIIRSIEEEINQLLTKYQPKKPRSVSYEEYARSLHAYLGEELLKDLKDFADIFVSSSNGESRGSFDEEFVRILLQFKQIRKDVAIAVIEGLISKVENTNTKQQYSDELILMLLDSLEYNKIMLKKVCDKKSLNEDLKQFVSFFIKHVIEINDPFTLNSVLTIIQDSKLGININTSEYSGSELEKQINILKNKVTVDGCTAIFGSST